MGLAKSRSGALMALWGVINLFLLLYIIFAWLASSNAPKETCHEEGSSDEYAKASTSFVLVWQIILAVFISARGQLAFALFIIFVPLHQCSSFRVGTYVLRYERTEFSLGVFVGMALLLGNWMFTIAVASGAKVMEKRNLKSSIAKTDDIYLEMEAFTAVILFLLYMLLCALLVKWKVDLIGDLADEDPHAEEDDICTDIPRRPGQIQLT